MAWHKERAATQRRKSTKGQARSWARKRRNQKAKQERLKTEAVRLGITVLELGARHVREKAKIVTSLLAFSDEQERSRRRQEERRLAHVRERLSQNRRGLAGYVSSGDWLVGGGGGSLYIGP